MVAAVAAATAYDPVEMPGTAAVELYDVHASHPGDPGRPVLQGVSLLVPAGGYTAVLGPEGSGKTTLLNVLALTRRPDRGECVLFGEATSHLEAFERARIRRGIESVAASPELVPHLTVLENVMLGMFTDAIAAPERHRRAADLLHAVGMFDAADRPAAWLSGGEGGRVAIAAALASRPLLLLVDDPGPDMLDAIGAARVEGLAVVTATRSRDVAERADQVVPLEAASASAPAG